MNSSKLIQYALFGGVLDGYFFFKRSMRKFNIYDIYLDDADITKLEAENTEFLDVQIDIQFPPLHSLNYNTRCVFDYINTLVKR